MIKLITFGKYKNKNASLLIEDKSYCKWLLKQDNLRIKYKKDFELIENDKLFEIKNKKISDINFWDLPSDIRIYIFNINKEAERREWNVNIYFHLNGKCKVVKTARLKDYYWMNCVSCGKDLPYDSDEKKIIPKMMIIKSYHWCYKCFLKYKPYDKKGNLKQNYTDDGKPLLTSRPIQLGHDKCPLIINDKLVLKSPDSYTELIYASQSGDYYYNGDKLLL